MGKQELRQRETNVATKEGVGKQLEQTFTVDDSALPSPQELEAYQRIDPRIVDMLIENTRKEQEHRHETDRQKLKILRRSESRTERINFWGMAFAFLSVTLFVGLTAWALYLDHPWFAGLSGFGALITIVSIFVDTGKSETKKK
ncbi:MAG: DUF2335 domain-containing protein [Prevotella sp.]|nr:DUF2335 domain-containing protein [Prevotella sp.]